MRRTIFRYSGVVSVALGMLFVPAAAGAQQQPQALSVQQLTSDVYVVTGGGGNSGVVIGADGVVVIDAKTSPESGKALLELTSYLLLQFRKCWSSQSFLNFTSLQFGRSDMANRHLVLCLGSLIFAFCASYTFLLFGYVSTNGYES